MAFLRIDDLWVGIPGEGNANLQIGAEGNADREIGVPREGNANLRIGTEGKADQEIGVSAGVPPDYSPWHSRGYLPHFDGEEAIQHVTFHLADSLSKETIARLRFEVEHLPEAQRKRALTVRLQDWVDAGHGSCVLREPDVAAMMEGVLLFFDQQRYILFEWVVMPNHVHVLFKPLHGWKVSKIVASWKKFSASMIVKRNASLRTAPLSSPIWHREYWDRFMRDAAHFRRAADYIRNNPVKAGLVEKAEQWKWGSASRGGGSL